MRLTNSIRDMIISSVIASKFDKRKAAIEKEYSDFAEKVYKKLVPSDVRKALSAVPDGYLKIDKCLRFNINGMNLRIDHKTGLPVKMNSHCEPVGSISDDDLRDEYLDINKRNEAMNQERTKMRQAVTSLLYGVQTYKVLCETWPEGEKFYKEFKPKEEKSTLPAVIIDDLNKMLGINQEKGK